MDIGAHIDLDWSDADSDRVARALAIVVLVRYIFLPIVKWILLLLLIVALLLIIP
jgi:hypothetical protein